MTETGPRPGIDPPARRACPRCEGRLGEPIGGDVHCYVECTRCGTRFELDDPELSGDRGRSGR